MLLNLSKGFDFSREDSAYHVDYLFTKEKKNEPLSGEDLLLIMHISINHAAQKVHKVIKPTSTLYQSNEEIENMIKAETFSFSET